MQEDEGYRRYQKLEQELGQIPVWDDRFETVLDEMERIAGDRLPKRDGADERCQRAVNKNCGKKSG